MAKVWENSLYRLKSVDGKEIKIDVTTSVSPGLPPHGALRKHVIPFLKQRKVQSVLDFGCGSLRHTFPLLEAGFDVCAVEFEECFGRPHCSAYLQLAEKNPNFSALVWPRDFLTDRRKFDAALLCYVLQVMPVPKERRLVLKHIAKKLRSDSYLLYMSRYNQGLEDDKKHRVMDGAYRWPDRDLHSFYREFTTEETRTMIEPHGFKRIRSLSERGTEQVFFYCKGKATWI